MLSIGIFTWWIVPFINKKWPSLALLIDFSLKSTFSDINMATPACLWDSFAWKTFFLAFDSKSVFILLFSKMNLFYSTNSWVLLLTQFAVLWLWIGALRPFTVSVNNSCSHIVSLPIPCLLVSYFISWVFLCLTLPSSCICKNLLSLFCSVDFVDINSFSFSLLWMVLISLSKSRVSCARENSLG
jgi:hypothetical protein